MKLTSHFTRRIATIAFAIAVTSVVAAPAYASHYGLGQTATQSITIRPDVLDRYIANQQSAPIRPDVLDRYIANQQSVPLRPDVRDRSVTATSGGLYPGSGAGPGSTVANQQARAQYVNAPGQNVNPQWLRDVGAQTSTPSQTSDVKSGNDGFGWEDAMIAAAAATGLALGGIGAGLALRHRRRLATG